MPILGNWPTAGAAPKGVIYLGREPQGPNSLKSPQEIRTRSDAHGSKNIQEGRPFDIIIFLAIARLPE
jgi:hypothetical protein